VTRLSGQELRNWRMRCAMVFWQFNIVGRDYGDMDYGIAVT
jgi:ABC-type phosphate/phosphonate transport system ATPase subunit